MRWTALLLAVLVGASGCPSGTSNRYDTDEDGSYDDLDCAPTDPEVHPRATDPVGDGVDQGCDGSDGIDHDGDGDGDMEVVVTAGGDDEAASDAGKVYVLSPEL